MGRALHEDSQESYHQANTLDAYSYFFPEQSAIQDLDLLNREASSLEIPESYLVNFEKKLQTRDVQGTVQAIQELVATIKEGPYSAEYSRIILLKTVSVSLSVLIRCACNQPRRVH